MNKTETKLSKSLDVVKGIVQPNTIFLHKKTLKLLTTEHGHLIDPKSGDKRDITYVFINGNRFTSILIHDSEVQRFAWVDTFLTIYNLT